MILAMETSTGMMSAALFDGAGLVDAYEERIGRGHAEKLVPMIETLLDGRIPSRILVSVGPGSFTGIRVGIAAAQGLSIGWQVPCFGFSSLAVVAASMEHCEEDEVTVAMPGGHGELFVQDHALRPTTPLNEPASRLPAQAAELSKQLIVGPAATVLAAAGKGDHRAIEADPLARHVMILPEAERGLPLAPVYVRPPDAKPRAA